MLLKYIQVSAQLVNCNLFLPRCHTSVSRVVLGASTTNEKTFAILRIRRHIYIYVIWMHTWIKNSSQLTFRHLHRWTLSVKPWFFFRAGLLIHNFQTQLSLVQQQRLAHAKKTSCSLLAAAERRRRRGRRFTCKPRSAFLHCGFLSYSSLEKHFPSDWRFLSTVRHFQERLLR